MNRKSFPIQSLEGGGEIDPSVDPRTGSKFPLSRQGQIWKETLSQMGKNIQAAAKKRKEQQKPQQPQQPQEMQTGGTVDPMYSAPASWAMRRGPLPPTFLPPIGRMPPGQVPPLSRTFPIGRMPPTPAPRPTRKSNNGATLFQSGGKVPKPQGTDTVPIMATPGEFVLNRGAVETAGRPFLHALNEMGKGHPAMMQNGGQVQDDEQQSVPPMTPEEFDRLYRIMLEKDEINRRKAMNDPTQGLMQDGGEIRAGGRGAGSVQVSDVQQAQDVLGQWANLPWAGSLPGPSGWLAEQTPSTGFIGDLFSGDWTTGGQPTIAASDYGGGMRDFLYTMNQPGGFGGSNWGFGSGLTNVGGLSMGGIGGFGGTLFGGGGGGVGNEGRALLQEGGPVPNAPQAGGIPSMQGAGANKQQMMQRRQGFDAAKNRHFALRAKHQFQPQQMAQPQRRRRQQIGV